MNFLAHFYLTGNEDPHLLGGNFLGDFVKGNAMYKYSPSIQFGITIHRFIDHHTDQNSIFRKSKKRLFPQFRHYSGVIVDLFYDYLLATDWDNYHSVSLKEFTQTSYQKLRSVQSIFPAEAKYALKYMHKHDWLYHYKTHQGMLLALNGVSRRFGKPNLLNPALDYLLRYEREFRKEFGEFMPIITHKVTHQINPG